MSTFTAFLGLFCLVVVPLSLLALIRRRGTGEATSRLSARPIPKLFWWLTGMVIGALVYLGEPRLQAFGSGRAFWSFVVFLSGVIGLLCVLVLLVMIRPRHQKLARAMTLARSGQVAEAVAVIQRQIDTRGRSPKRSGALGDCYLLSERWRDAYIQFVDAEQLDGRGGRYLAKQAFALWKLGRGDEAITLLERATEIDDRNPSHAWTACLVLADLGRDREAREQLDRAAWLVEESIPQGTARRRALEESIEVCRKRLDSGTVDGATSSVRERD